MHTNMHPCLCDICLKARDEELHRARKALIEDIPDPMTFNFKRNSFLIPSDSLKQELRNKLL